MDKILEVLAKIVDRILDIRLFTSLLASILSSLTITLLVAVFLNLWVPKPTFPYVDFNSTIPVIIFVVTLACFTVLFYVLMTNENTDPLMTVRKQLIGNWSVKYTTWYEEKDGSLQEGTGTDVCTINIDPVTRKLTMVFKLQNNINFEDTNIRIDDISLNQNPLRLIYFHELDVRIRTDKLADFARTDPAFKSLVFARFDSIDLRKGETRMAGKWYDLDLKLSELMEQRQKKLHPSATVQARPGYGTIVFYKLEGAD